MLSIKSTDDLFFLKPQRFCVYQNSLLINCIQSAIIATYSKLKIDNQTKYHTNNIKTEIDLVNILFEMNFFFFFFFFLIPV